ncbi:putative RDD family membrane protein YckC [Kitasatospora gansuensis]|uniref:Putative RDD family membrane protein YckC n=1 Tax=Kitasatospora gansuensis TaxID=258050 RepID=A0A7W7SFC9_9ACTN|nr:RDD family protein [Kitasatospora gansuensis]MBB4949057.1 putative RDD family membrane protein YckC [Kitasatospora gansuensis]
MTERPLAGDLDTALDPAPGYYPDPSVPGFVRYWGGSAWVPGTSRPAPPAGESLAPPRGATHRAAATFAPAAPPPRPVVGSPGRVEPSLSALAAPPAPLAPSARSVPAAEETGPVFFDQTSGGASFVLAPYVERELQQTVQEPPVATAWQAMPTPQPEVVSWGAPAATFAEPTFRSEPAPAPEPTPVTPLPAPQSAPPVAVAVQPPAVAKPAAAKPAVVRPAVVKPVAVKPTAPAQAPAGATTRPPVPRRAGSRKPPTPLPAGLGRRAVARLVDTVALAVVAVAAGVPMIGSVITHIEDKVRLAEAASAGRAGQQVRVWLVDGLVLGRVAALLGVLVLAALLYEVLPVSRTGQTFGKRLAGIRVADMTRAALAPTFGRSMVRWLVRQVAVLSVVGLFAPLWDRSARRGWPDRAARTRVVRA